MLDPQEKVRELEAALAEKDARIAVLEAQVATLLAKVAELVEQLSRHSGNSNKPPSSDPPWHKGREGHPRAGKKRGGQPGHKGRARDLLPPEKITRFADHYPDQCGSCWEPLAKAEDPEAIRYQTVEVPAIVPDVTEHRFHSVRCSCGYRTRAAVEARVAGTPFGPRLTSLIGLFCGVYHLSRRTTVDLLGDVLGVRISLGALSEAEERVSKAVEPAVSQAWDKAREAPVKHTDGTSWAQAGKALSLWTLATAAVTVFKVVADGSRETLRPLYGFVHGILVSDRATALKFWDMERRQICWAHLLRKFVLFSEREGVAGTFGRELLDLTVILFKYWRDFKDGKIPETVFKERMLPVQQQIEDALTRAVVADVARLSGSCQDILDHKDALWTYLTVSGVEPTNNHAERELRAFVLWRKRCFGTQSERGNRFAERLMTIAHTARKQGRNVLAFLTECCVAQANATALPLLFGPATAS